MDEVIQIDYEKMRKNPLLVNKTDEELYEIELKKRMTRAKNHAQNKLVNSIITKMVYVKEDGKSVKKELLDVIHDPVIKILMDKESDPKLVLDAYKTLTGFIMKTTAEQVPQNMIQVNQTSDSKDNSKQEIIFSNKIKGLND